ncbi:protein of unknown function [Ruminococcaceae bacterium BL-6]|nr:protein of unknown function [Ruminococcaceae bacterium BL-6]
MSRIPGAFDAGRTILSELDKPLDFSNGVRGEGQGLTAAPPLKYNKIV